MRESSVEFVAVVLAASTGARLFPLTSADHPKHLLPVGGIPLLARLLSVLHAAGFTQVVVGVASDDNATADLLKGLRGVSQDGSTYLYLTSLQITLSFLPVDCAGSAEALRILSNSLPKKCHILVLPGDFVVLETSCLVALVDAHRRGNTQQQQQQQQQYIPTACTVLLADTGEQDEHGVPIKETAKAKKGGLARDEEDIEYIGLSVSSNSKVSNFTSSSSPRLVWKQSKIDVEQDEEFTGNTPKLLLPKPRLRCGTVTTIRMDWSDVHAYVFSPWVRHLWTFRSSLVSVQGDLVPLLIGRQWQGIRATFGTEATAADVEQLMEDSMPESQSELEKLDLTKEYAVRAHVLHGSKVMRASTIPSYLHAGREVIIQAVEQDLKQDQDQSQNPCVALPDGTSLNVKLFSAILKGTELGDKVQCKLCTIGHDVKLSAKCRLNNVIVMDHVTVGENCVLQNSILGEGCIIGENCNLNDCQVPPGKIVPAGTKEKGESFMDVDDAYR